MDNLVQRSDKSLKKSKKKIKKSRKKRKRYSSTSSDKSSSSSSSDLSTSSSSSSGKKSKEDKRKLKKYKKKKKKLTKIKRKKEVKTNDSTSSDDDDNTIIGPTVPNNLVDITKRMAPETKEEWVKRQNVIKRVYDEQTGRYRLIKGDGEVLEEIVSKDRHKEINKQATVGDGQYFQSNLPHLYPKLN